jgi:hypothetical protein
LFDKEFKSLDEKRDYIKAELVRRGEWHTADEMQRMREALSAQKKLAGVLLPEMPIRKLGQSASKNPKIILREVDGMREIEIRGLGKTKIPDDWDDVKVKANIAALCARFKKPQEPLSRPPQARIPHKITEVKKTREGKGVEVILDTGHRMYTFRNSAMDEKGTKLFDILLGAVGKMAIFLTKADAKGFWIIEHVLRVGDQEWTEEGVPVLRREPRIVEQREPGMEG